MKRTERTGISYYRIIVTGISYVATVIVRMSLMGLNY